MIRLLCYAFLLNILSASIALMVIILLGFYNVGALMGMGVGVVLLLPAQYDIVKKRRR